MVEQLPHHPKVEGLSPGIATSDRRENDEKTVIANADYGGIVVEQLPPHLTIEGSSIGITTSDRRENDEKIDIVNAH